MSLPEASRQRRMQLVACFQLGFSVYWVECGVSCLGAVLGLERLTLHPKLESLIPDP